MWMMILIAVNLNNPQDQPGRIEMMFPTQQSCEEAKSTMKYNLRSKSFKVVAECKKQT